MTLNFGITQRAVVNYETLGRVPKGAVLRKICEQYGVAERWLLTSEGSMHQQEVSCAELPSKTSDMSEVLEDRKLQHIDFIDSDKKKTSGTSEVLEARLTTRCLRLADENADLLRQNGDLRVEAERLRMDDVAYVLTGERRGVCLTQEESEFLALLRRASPDVRKTALEVLRTGMVITKQVHVGRDNFGNIQM